MSNSTDTPKGYRQSPLGQIPEDWNVERLFNIADVYSGGTPKSSNLQYFDGNIPFIKSGEIGLSQTEHCISEDGLKASSAKMVKKGDLLYALYGATSGQCAISKINGAINQAVLCIRPQCNRYFLLCVLEKNKDLYYRRYLQGGQGNLSAEIVKRYYIPIPSIEEQMKIAEVLSTWDKAIELQTAIIEKLTLRKKGLMQQLLTGKKRLKGFSEPFCYIRAGEVFRSSSIKGAGTEELLSATQENGVVPRRLLEGRVTMPAGNTDNFKLVEKGDFVISLRSFQGGIEYSEYQGIVSPAYIVLKPKLHIDDSFYKYYFKSSDFIGHLAIAVIGIRDGRQISYDYFCFVKIPFPSLEEQCAISEILVLNDREIEKEKQKLEALKQQKKGLMQQLLTGKKRVITK
ncbi:MAG: restriction endonuclease subunit S [Bacteroidales bacterium]|nr:restriction endonuclease subunit S [Bacteroidales bacterium]